MGEMRLVLWDEIYGAITADSSDVELDSRFGESTMRLIIELETMKITCGGEERVTL